MCDHITHDSIYVYMLARNIVREMSAIIEKFRNPQTFLSETCSQCRNNDGNFNHDNCFDPVDPNTNSLYEGELYRTSDDKKCWSKYTYDSWLKPIRTNPLTRAQLRDTVEEQDTENIIARLHKILKNADLGKITVRNINIQIEAALQITLSEDRKQMIRDEIERLFKSGAHLLW
jgi:hypothetical protein